METKEEPNWPLAFLMARYNASQVEKIFSKWPVDQAEDIPIHEIVFCSTNLAFATELYLKAAHIAFTGKRPGGHMLWNLFKDLPKFRREKILSNYDLNFENNFKELSNGELWLRFGEGDLPKSKRPSSLTEVLDHFSIGYTEWRYIFSERENKASPSLYGLHYSRLMCLCHTIDDYLRAEFPTVFPTENEIRL